MRGAMAFGPSHEAGERQAQSLGQVGVVELVQRRPRMMRLPRRGVDQTLAGGPLGCRRADPDAS